MKHKTAFISHADCGRHDTGWGHPEHVGRLRAITRALRNDYELFQSVYHLEGRHATVDELCLAHDRDYVDQVYQVVLNGGGRLDSDTVASEGSWDAATAAAGCVLDAVDMAFDGSYSRSFSAVRPPGHHALYNRAMGFCMFGNVAIGAYYALKMHRAEKVLIVDWDVHHGNGTQALVEDDPNIRFVSMHQWPWYPGTGATEDRGPHQNVWNIALPPGLPAKSYVDEFKAGVESALEGFIPDIIFISAGFDCLAGDALGGFTLEITDMDNLTLFMGEKADSFSQGRLVSVLEGGYNTVRLGEASVSHLRSLASGELSE